MHDQTENKNTTLLPFTAGSLQIDDPKYGSKIFLKIMEICFFTKTEKKYTCSDGSKHYF
jgi:hypothetical protein